MTITTCVQCKKQFSNHANEPWCDSCKKESDEWAAPQSKSKNEIADEPRSLESNTKTPLSPRGKQLSSKLAERRTQKNIEPVLERDITPTPQNLTLVEPTTDEDTERPKMQNNALTTTRTKNVSANSSMPAEIEETPLAGSTQPSVDLNKEISHSMNLLNQSEQELFASMKGLRSDLPETTVRLYDPERVQTAVLCGRQIVESMKTKIELMKFAKEINGK